jgi:CubicO group peptidase (beta-lactamase class C family)
MLPQNPEFFMGGGGFYGTAGDYLTFLQMLMHGGTFNRAEIFRPQVVKYMSENCIDTAVNWMTQHPVANLSVPGVWKTTDGSASLDVDLAKMFPGQHLKWGYSFLINPQQGPNGRARGSLTWAGLANTYYWLDPTKRLAGVILTQSLPFWDPGVLGVYSQFEKSVYKALAAT